MRYVRLGQTELKVSNIAFGTWAFGGDWGEADLRDSDAAIGRALELGITLFDTAQGYGFGAAEQLLAQALRGRVRREEVVIATKGGLRLQDGNLLRDASAGWLRQGVEASLRNLDTDYIDLYQLHWPDLHTPAAETAGALAELVAEGKIRHVGVFNYDVPQMEELSWFGPLETLQPPYHLFHREIEDQILPYAASHDLGVLVYGPLAHGLLARRPDDPRHQLPARRLAQPQPRRHRRALPSQPGGGRATQAVRPGAGHRPARAGGRLDAGEPGGAGRDRRRPQQGAHRRGDRRS